MIFTERTGKRYGRLIAVSKTNRRSTSGEIFWKCKCDCGVWSEVLGGHLTSGHTSSCGCLSPEVTSATMKRHGESRKITPEYRAWKHINNRCHNPRNKSYPNYGARGIKVCKKWRKSYESFLKDMGRRPSSSLQIERLDNDGDYKFLNCIWGTRKQQANNKRNNVFATHLGITKTLAQWSEDTGIKYWTLRKQFKKGMTISTLIAKYGNRHIPTLRA